MLFSIVPWVTLTSVNMTFVLVGSPALDNASNNCPALDNASYNCPALDNATYYCPFENAGWGK